MKAGINSSAFLKDDATIFFPKGATTLASRAGKVAAALSLVAAVTIATPHQAEAHYRGGGAGVAMGFVGGMMIGSALSQQRYYAPPPVVMVPVQPVQQQYQPVQQYQQPGQMINGGQPGRPGWYFCPRGPQQLCTWKQGKLEGTSIENFAEADVAEAPVPRMG
jgi:hypothetical protein